MKTVQHESFRSWPALRVLPVVPVAVVYCAGGGCHLRIPGIDRANLRTLDTRWGYNGKPTRTPADNGGNPVVAAGDEIAYHYGSGPDQGSTDVYLIDILLGHCGPTPSVTFRHFTGEEPGFWTGAGRLR